MLNSYVGSYNNTYSQAKINEVLHSISLEVSQWKQKNTQQQFGHIRYEGSVSNIANIEILDKPSENTPVIGTIQHKPAYLGYIGVDGKFHSSFNNIMAKIPYVYTTTTSFWQARNWNTRYDISTMDTINSYNSFASTYFFHNRWGTEIRTNNNFSGHRIVAENTNVNYFTIPEADMNLSAVWLNASLNFNSTKALNSVNVFVENNDVNPIFNVNYGTTFSSNYAFISTKEYNAIEPKPNIFNTKPTFTITDTAPNNNKAVINVWYNYSDTENVYLMIRYLEGGVYWHHCNYFAMTQPIVSNEGIITSAITKRYDYTNLLTIGGQNLSRYSSIDVIRNTNLGYFSVGVNMNCWCREIALTQNFLNTQFVNFNGAIGQMAIASPQNSQTNLTYNGYNNWNGNWFTLNKMNLTVNTNLMVFGDSPQNLKGWWISPTLGGGNLSGAFGTSYDSIMYYNNKSIYKTISYSPYQKYWNTAKPIYDYQNYEQITAEQYASNGYAFVLPSRYIGRNIMTVAQGGQLIYDAGGHPALAYWIDYIRDINAVLYTNCKIENTVVTSTYVSYDNGYNVTENVYVDIYYRKK